MTTPGAAAAVVSVVVMMILANTHNAAGGPLKPAEEQQTQPSTLQQQQQQQHTLTALNHSGTHLQQRRFKRFITNRVDSSCKGFYSRRIWNELTYLCEDCDNVFREKGYQAECRRGCFDSYTFKECLLVLGKDVKRYESMASSLRGS